MTAEKKKRAPRTLQDLLREGQKHNKAGGIKCPKCHCPDLRVAWALVAERPV